MTNLICFGTKLPSSAILITTVALSPIRIFVITFKIINLKMLNFYVTSVARHNVTADHVISVSLSPQPGASSGYGWRNGMQYGG